MKNFSLIIVILLVSACGRQNSNATASTGGAAVGAASAACASHAVGESFMAPDGINSCSCDSLGREICTLMAAQ